MKPKQPKTEKKERTHITVILDRTGSMESIRDDTIGGFNAFLEKQKNQPDHATLTLVQFDSQDPYEVIHHFKSIEYVPELNRETYVPRASTPLFDAIGRGINDLETNLSTLKNKEKPSRTLFVIVTDGQENASREFTKEQVEKMIQDRTEKENWQFVFLSADLGASLEAGTIGVKDSMNLPFEKDAKGSACAWDSLSERVSEYRAGAVCEMAFSDVDRKREDDPFRKKSAKAK